MRKAIFILMMVTLGQVFGQEYLIFSDSPSASYYDPSFGYFSGASKLELIGGSKFPVETAHAFSGTNSLRLRWTSASGGDWGIAAAAEGWRAFDFSAADSISFQVYSPDTLSNQLLPFIFIEDINNRKTPRQMLSFYSGSLPAGQWVKITVPVQIFRQNPGSTDLKKIKTIYWGQGTADAKEHVLYIDEIRAFRTSDKIPPSVPQNVRAQGFEKHIDISWSLNSESDVAGYRIYKIKGSGKSISGSTDDQTSGYSDYIGQYDSSSSYRVSAFDSSGNESPLSAEVSSVTNALSDSAKLDMLQRSTFRYFWDYAHPVSGMARERKGSRDVVTSGGSGFGLMSILAAMERGFITHEEGRGRILKIVDFMHYKAEKFHGAFSHWLNGRTGKAVAFSQYDNGGDLVETAFAVQGLLTVREYFRSEQSAEADSIVSLSTKIWEGVEWDWYRKDGGNYLYWHWSPNYGWYMNMRITGFNEAMIVYLLAIASPTHPVQSSAYSQGWAAGSSYPNKSSYYGFPIYVGYGYGGPLFFAHYSYLGFDPRGWKDRYANYFVRNRNHALINRAYCINNPKGFPGYSDKIWGLTASDDPFGYSAHEPFGGDNGTITPTAALSSMPYTPKESTEAFSAMYNLYGKNIWGYMGFTDAFNVKENWYSGSYIAIDQGPIVIMTENYRSGLLWKNFMKNPEFINALIAAGFVRDTVTDVAESEQQVPEKFALFGNYPNPFNPETRIVFSIPAAADIKVEVFDMLGRRVATLYQGYLNSGRHEMLWNGMNGNSAAASGVYFCSVEFNGKRLISKMLLQK